MVGSHLSWQLLLESLKSTWRPLQTSHHQCEKVRKRKVFCPSHRLWKCTHHTMLSVLSWVARKAVCSWELRLLVQCLWKTPKLYRHMKTIPKYCHKPLRVRNLLEIFCSLFHYPPSWTSSALTSSRSAIKASFRKNASSVSADLHCHQLQKLRLDNYAFENIFLVLGEHVPNDTKPLCSLLVQVERITDFRQQTIQARDYQGDYEPALPRGLYSNRRSVLKIWPLTETLFDGVIGTSIFNNSEMKKVEHFALEWSAWACPVERDGHFCEMTQNGMERA